MNLRVLRTITRIAAIGSAVVTTGAARGNGAAPRRAADSPTFSRDIAPIIFQHCTPCHGDRQAAPFSLASYEDVRKRAQQIVAVTAAGYMPPWLPEPTVTGGGFLGERRLHADQIAAIRQWVEAGAPEGGAAELPPAPHLAPEWLLGKPDVVITMEEPFELAAEGDDVLHTIVWPLDFLAQQPLRALDFRPSNPRIVHHVSFLFDPTMSARMLDKAVPGAGYPGMGGIGLNQAGGFGTWTQGAPARELPPGIVRTLPQQCDLVAEVHLNPTGKPETLSAEIGLYFPRGPVERMATSIALGTFFIDIPVGEVDYRIKDTFTLPVDVDLISLSPHAHYLCRAMKIGAVTPDGTVTRLLEIRDWDFNWQEEYHYREPVRLAMGTRIEMEFTYDNSADNPRNPFVPPRGVRNGHKVTDEMAALFLYLAPVENEALAQIEEAGHTHVIELLQRARAQRAEAAPDPTTKK